MMSESQLDLWGFDDKITKCTDTPQAITSKGSSLNSFISIIGTVTSNTSVTVSYTHLTLPTN